MYSNGSKWIHTDQLNINGYNWIPLGSQWIQRYPNLSKWIQVDLNRTEQPLTNKCSLIGSHRILLYGPSFSIRRVLATSGVKIGLIWVKKDKWTGYFDGWQGCSEGKAQGKFQGTSLPARGKARPCQLFCSDLHSISHSFFFQFPKCKTEFF